MNEVHDAESAEPSRSPEPPESLSGDRLCMRCMHPLAGCPIVRDAGTGLLFVRCSECGTASALFEYPTVGPWLRRMKAVAAATLVALGVLLVLAIGGITVGFVTAATEASADTAGVALAERHKALGGTALEPTWDGSAWATVPSTWVQSAEGAREIAAVRWSKGPLLVLCGLSALGAVVLTPFVATLGIILMRRTWIERALACAAIVGVASLLAMLLNFATNGARGMPSWREVASTEHATSYAVCTGVLLMLATAAAAVAAPIFAAALARFVLPPSDRRLVAWLWEWRGKPVPRT